MDTIKAFVSKNQGTFSNFHYDQQGTPILPLPSCMPVSLKEYPSKFLNIPKCPWKCLNQLFWLCPGSEYAWSPYMFNRLLKIPQILIVPGLWIWLISICKCYMQVLYFHMQIQNMSENAWICLNALQYAWPWLNVAKCPWICL